MFCVEDGKDRVFCVEDGKETKVVCVSLFFICFGHVLGLLMHRCQNSKKTMYNNALQITNSKNKK